VIRWLFRPLDRYVFSEFWRIFALTSLGFPLLIIIIDLTDNLEKYLNRRVPPRDIALAYVYGLPEWAFLVLPAAVLFATVFSISSLTRHSEITAAKASGISFYRMILPILIGAMIATGIDLAIGEMMPVTSRMRNDLLEGPNSLRATSTLRYNFAFAGEEGRVYKAGQLNTDSGTIRALQIERKGTGPNYPTYLLSAQSAKYDSVHRRWTLRDGALTVVSDTGMTFAVQFQAARDTNFTERPSELMAREPDPKELRYRELSRYIAAHERSGRRQDKNKVERALKIAVPFTCLIIALFGAPLATSTQRGGAAYGVAVSLGTTVVFLLMVQLTKAIGSNGVIPPDLAAWIPGAIFAFVGLVLLARVRT
jgi:lipopolysaccharide export system permease protein